MVEQLEEVEELGEMHPAAQAAGQLIRDSDAETVPEDGTEEQACRAFIGRLGLRHCLRAGMLRVV